MTTAETDVPVLIAGAGPTGLTLACDLARRGIPCRIVDKARTLFPGSRGKGLQPRTLEVFDDLGVLDAILAAGMPFPAMRMYAGTTVRSTHTITELLGVDPIVPGTGVPYPGMWLLPQSRTDRILRDRLADLGGHLEPGVELTAFTQDAEGVTATLSRNGESEQVRAAYLVGADGGHSQVRRQLGVGFEGETFQSERTLIGDVRAEGLDGVYAHVLTAGGDVTDRFSLWSMPGDDGQYQFVASMGADEVPAPTLAAVQQLLDSRSGRTDIRLHDLTWLSLYRVNARMVDRFRVGRVLLAGDAAHVHSSAGGQGLNTSVQDAYNLGWKLAAVLTGASEDLLDSYEAERMPVAADILGLSTTLHRRSFVRPMTDAGDAGPDLFQLRLNYRGGPLAYDGRDRLGAVRAGDRAPDATCKDAAGLATRLFDLFRGPHWTLLGFGPDTEDTVTEVNRGYRDRVHAHPVGRADGSWRQHAAIVDTEGQAHRNYQIDPGNDAGTLVLVRPDGYLGLVIDAGRPHLLHDYLRRLTPAADR